MRETQTELIPSYSLHVLAIATALSQTKVKVFCHTVHSAVDEIEENDISFGLFSSWHTVIL